MRRSLALMFPCVRALLLGATFVTLAAADGVGMLHTQADYFGLDGSNFGDGQDVPNLASSSTFSIAPFTTTATDGSYRQTASASAASGQGLLRAQVQQTITCLQGSCGTYAVPPASGFGDVFAPSIDASAWFNAVTFMSSTSGVTTLQGRFAVDGTTTITGGAISSAFLMGETCSIDNPYCYAGANNRVLYSAALAPNGSSSISLNMAVPAFDTQFELEYIVDVGVEQPLISGGFLTGTSSASVDFSHTVQLLSLVGLDANGNVVPGAVIYDISGAGIPGMTPVPEPTTWVGIGVGLLFLIAMSHRNLSSRSC
jgi:hypothetical protein